MDPGGIDSLEYETGGDVASVAIQYSYLPSWVSFIVDQSRAREAGRALFDAVYDRWNDLPADQRPELLLFGVSLGSFSGEAAFSGEFDLRNRTDGALFAGPPNFNTLFREFTDGRDAGSPEVQPVFRDGRTVRFTDDPSAPISPAGAPWDGTRVLYLSAPVGPDRLVEHRSGAPPAGLAGRAGRQRCAGRDGVDPVRDVLAGHRGHDRTGPGAAGARPQLHQPVRRRLGRR